MSTADSAMSISVTARRHRVAFFCILVATLVGGIIRFWNLGGRDFWFDESCTYLYVRHFFDWPFKSSLLVESTNTPYYFLLRFWTDFFGDSEVSYRSFSALAATLTVGILGVAAWRLRGGLAGGVATILAAVHPLHVYYAGEARAYALWMLLLSASLFTLIEAARTGRVRWWVAFGACISASLPTHYFSIYFLGASVGCVFLSDDRRRVFRQWAITAGVVMVGFVPWLIYAVLPAASLGGAKWVEPGFDVLLSIPRTLWALLPCGAYPGYLRGLSVSSSETMVQPSFIVVLSRVVPVFLLAVIAMVVVERRRATAHRTCPRELCFLMGVSVGSLVLAWLYAVLVRPNYLVGRYDMVGWPGFVLLMSILVSEFARVIRKGLVFSLVGCVVLVACSSVPLVRMNGRSKMKSLYRLRAEAIASRARADDLIITFSYDRDAMSYYYDRAGGGAATRSFPSWLDDQIGWVDSEADLCEKRRPALVADARALAQLAREKVRNGHRVFLMADSSDPRNEGRRAELRAVLVEALRKADLQLRLVDAVMLIERIEPAE